MDQGTYVASGSIAHSSNNSAAILNTMVEAVTSTELSEIVALQLDDEELVLIDGTILSAEIIKTNLTAATIPNSFRISITFSYPDEILSVTILNKIIDQSITFANDTYINLGNNVILGEYALSSTFEGIPSNIYLAFGASIGLLVGGFVSVVLNAFKGTIYYTQDVKEFEISSYYLQMKIKSRLTLNRFLNLVGLGKKINFEREQTKLILQGLVEIGRAHV